MRVFSRGVALCALAFLAACNNPPGTPVAGADPGAAPAAQSFAQQVAAFNANAQAAISSFNSNAGTDLVAVGKSACGFLSMADGLFTAVAPALGSPEQRTEAAVMTGVQAGCAIVDGVDPSKPAPVQLAQAVNQVVAAIPMIKTALKAASPAAAQTAAAVAP